MANIDSDSTQNLDWSSLGLDSNTNSNDWRMGGEVDGHGNNPDVEHDVHAIDQLHNCIETFEQWADNNPNGYVEEIASANTGIRYFAERISSWLGTQG